MRTLARMKPARLVLGLAASIALVASTGCSGGNASDEGVDNVEETTSSSASPSADSSSSSSSSSSSRSSSSSSTSTSSRSSSDSTAVASGDNSDTYEGVTTRDFARLPETLAGVTRYSNSMDLGQHTTEAQYRSSSDDKQAKISTYFLTNSNGEYQPIESTSDPLFETESEGIQDSLDRVGIDHETRTFRSKGLEWTCHEGVDENDILTTLCITVQYGRVILMEPRAFVTAYSIDEQNEWHEEIASDLADGLRELG